LATRTPVELPAIQNLNRNRIQAISTG
jgi:hypothetical protein